MTPDFFSDPFAFDRMMQRQRTMEREAKPDYMVFSTPGKQPSGLAEDIMGLVQMMTSSASAPRAATPKIYEMGNRLIQVDESGPTEIYSAPVTQKDVAKEFRLKAAQQKVLELQRAAFNPDSAREFRLRNTTPEAELGKAIGELSAVEKEFGVAAPAPQPQPATPEPFVFNPLQAAMGGASTNAPAATAPQKLRRWVRDSSGKMVESK